MSSPEEGSPYLAGGGGSPVSRGISRSGSLTMDKSRSRSYLTKDISLDEGDVLKKISEEAEAKLLRENKKAAEARSYWHQKRVQEQQDNYSDEENEFNSDGLTSTSTPVNRSGTPTYRKTILEEPLANETNRTSTRRPRSPLDNTVDEDSHVSNGVDMGKHWQDKYNELEGQFKEALVSQAKLYDEKTALVYQVETLKDQLEDANQTIYDMKSNAQKQQSLLLHAKHTEDTLHTDIDKLKHQIRCRDNFMETHGLHLPTIHEEEEENDTTNLQFYPMEERDGLLKEIANLKEELENVKTNNMAIVAPTSDSLLRGEETKDIVRESTRLVSEYKNKLQLSEAETTRLEGTVERLKGQVTRYKTQQEDVEKREDELLKEKRNLSREVRRLQSSLDDLESENELLKRRVEQMRKKQKD